MGFMDRIKQLIGGGGGGGSATGPSVDERAPEATRQEDPAVQSASAEQSPEEQREAAAGDPASMTEPGTEGQRQEPS